MFASTQLIQIASQEETEVSKSRSGQPDGSIKEHSNVGTQLDAVSFYSTAGSWKYVYRIEAPPAQFTCCFYVQNSQLLALLSI